MRRFTFKYLSPDKIGKQQPSAADTKFLSLKALIEQDKTEQFKQEISGFDINYVYNETDSSMFDGSHSDKFEHYQNKITLLHIAIQKKNLEIVKFLHGIKADLSFPFEADWGYTHDSFDHGQGHYSAHPDSKHRENDSVVTLPTTLADKVDDSDIFNYLILNDAKYKVEELSEARRAVVLEHAPAASSRSPAH